jgi:glycosyltransferase
MQVSIITGTYNSEETVEDTVVSVQKQTYKDIEHIIVDGASSDKTLEIVRNAGHCGPVKSEKDNGIYDAMNKGIELATGEIVGILNSDDFYTEDDVVERVVETFQSSGCDAVYGDLDYVDANDTKKVLRKWVAGGYKRSLFLNGWMPPHPTFFVRKDVYKKFGNFNTSLKSSADYELLLRFLFINEIKVVYIPGVMVHMRAGGHSNRSLLNRLKAHKEDYMAWKLNGISPKWYTLALKPMRKVKQFIFRGTSSNTMMILLFSQT